MPPVLGTLEAGPRQGSRLGEAKRAVAQISQWGQERAWRLVTQPVKASL